MPVHPRPPTGRASSSPCLSPTHTEPLTSEVFPPPRRPFPLAVDAACICCPHTSSDSSCLWTEGFSRAGRVLSSRLLLTHHSLVMSANVGGGCDALGRVPGTGLNTKTGPLLSGVSVLRQGAPGCFGRPRLAQRSVPQARKTEADRQG